MVEEPKAPVGWIVHIFANYLTGFSSDNCIFLYASIVETSRFGNSNVPSYIFLNEKLLTNTFTTTIKSTFNTSYLELCQ